MKEFKFSFQLSRIAVLTVCYYKLVENESAEFTISVTVLHKGGAKGGGAVARFVNKFNTCGQCQEEGAKGYVAARLFVHKFNQLHRSDLTEEQYMDVVAGIEDLKQKYNWIESDSFDQIVSMSKLIPKKI